jgi:hypothetical protein
MPSAVSKADQVNTYVAHVTREELLPAGAPVNEGKGRDRQGGYR